LHKFYLTHVLFGLWYLLVNHLVPQSFGTYWWTIWYHRALVLTGEQFGTTELW